MESHILTQPKRIAAEPCQVIYSGPISEAICRPMEWFVYIIECDNGSLYTGITTDIVRRFRDHDGGAKGARYFNGRKPLKVVWSERGHDQSSATRREIAIKQLTRRQKLILVGSASGDHSA